MDNIAEYADRIAAEIAQVRRYNTDLLAANVRLEHRVLDAEADRDRLAREVDYHKQNGSIFCGFEKGEPIQKTGGDYDADAQFVCAFEWQGLVRFVGAIPQKRGCLFYIFHPRQVTPRVLPAHDEDTAKPKNSPLSEGPIQSPAPRRFRHRMGGSTYVLVGEAELQREIYHALGMQGADAVPRGTILTVYRSEGWDGPKFWARTTAEFNDGRFEELPPAPGANA